MVLALADGGRIHPLPNFWHLAAVETA